MTTSPLFNTQLIIHSSTIITMAISPQQPLPNSSISSKLTWPKPVINFFKWVVSYTTELINFSNIPMENVDSCATQLVNGKGVFNSTGLNNFMETLDVADTDLGCPIFSIIGRQSSGKSTLMNLLLGTQFKEMNASKGRSQTTEGIWIAKTGMESCTIALDIEGTDGGERGEDDTAFERQSALFALAVSDVVMINMWWIDIGCDHAANKPLLRIIFQVMLRILCPRMITLMFVIRDKPTTLPKDLQSTITQDIQKIWNAIPKPSAHEHAPLSNFFKVEVTALSNYERQKVEFIEEVSELRKRLYHSIRPRGLAGDQRDATPMSAFSIIAPRLWEDIRRNRDLDLPRHKEMVATVRCEAIANEMLDQLLSNKEWMESKEAAQSGSVEGFGKKLSSIIATYRSHYDEKTKFYVEAVRNKKWNQLESNALNEAYHAYSTIIGHLRSEAFDDFTNKLDQALNNGKGFDSTVRKLTRSIVDKFKKRSADAAVRQANWDASKVKDGLLHDINSHALYVRNFLVKTKGEERTGNLAQIGRGTGNLAKIGRIVGVVCVTVGASAIKLLTLDPSIFTDIGDIGDFVVSGKDLLCELFKQD